MSIQQNIINSLDCRRQLAHTVLLSLWPSKHPTTWLKLWMLRWALVLNLNITCKCKDQKFVHWNTWTCTFLCQVWTCISLSKCTAGKTELEFRTCTLSISVADFETWRRICIVSSQPCHAGNINGDFDQLNLHLYWSFRLHGKELALFQKVQPFEKLYLHCTWISVQVQVQIFKVIVQKFSLHFQVRPSKE